MRRAVRLGDAWHPLRFTPGLAARGGRAAEGHRRRAGSPGARVGARASRCGVTENRSPTRTGSPARAPSTRSSTTSTSCACSARRRSCSTRSTATDARPASPRRPGGHWRPWPRTDSIPGTEQSMTPDDEKFLRRAIELAARPRAAGERAVRLAAGRRRTATSWPRTTTPCVTDADITAHPELKLARWAARELAPDAAAGTTMYTSCQPCGDVRGRHRPVRPRPGGVRAVHRAVRASVKPATPPLPPVPATRGRRCSTRRASRSTTTTDLKLSRGGVTQPELTVGRLPEQG